MSEQAVQIGNLSALVHKPEKGAGSVAVIMLNAGLLHRVGPYRLYVKLARELGKLGFISLRLDLSGLGYSAKESKDAQSDQSATQDTARAMDFLQRKYDCSQFVLLGLCSGAENAHEAAVTDPRVVGGVFLDGYAYPNFRQRLFHYARRGTSLAKWQQWLGQRFNTLLGREDPAEALRKAADEMWEIPTPPIEKTLAQLQQLKARSAQMLFVFAGGSGDYSYQDQFADTMPGLVDGSQVQVLYFPKADHMYVLQQDQSALIDAVAAWFTDRFQGRE